MTHREPVTQERLQFDPLLAAILASGTPASAALLPPAKEPTSLHDALAALAAWLGMALPGRGGLGMVRFPLKPSAKIPAEFGALANEMVGDYTPTVLDLRKPSGKRGLEDLKPLDPRTLVLGRSRGSDISRGVPDIHEANADETMKLLDVLWNWYELVKRTRGGSTINPMFP